MLHRKSPQIVKLQGRFRHGQTSPIADDFSKRIEPFHLYKARNASLFALMIIYHVAITIDTAIESEWREWMNRSHVPDVVRTGCFTECRIYRVIDSNAPDPSYVMQYHCRSLDDYSRYRENFAPALQKEHTDKFAGRFRGVRQILEEVARTS